MRKLEPGRPDRLGPYRLLAELGRGGMGVVFLGVDGDGGLVAVKRVHEHLLHDAEFRARFAREVETSGRVAGSRTAAVIAAEADAAVPWLATQLVLGPTLGEVLGAGIRLPEAAVLRLAAGLVDALDEVHDAGLVHRDLKPSNILLTDDGPVVIDFGIARALEQPDGADITRTNVVPGDPGHMSPEQAEEQPLTTASDVFPLGTVLLTAATGTNPFRVPGTFKTMRNVIELEPDLSALSPALRAVIGPCLAKSPGMRPSTAALRASIAAAGTPASEWPPAVNELAVAQARDFSLYVPGAVPGTALWPNGPTVVGPGASRRGASGAGEDLGASTGPSSGQDPAFGAAPGPEFAFDTASGQDFAPGVAFGQDFTDTASGQDHTPGAAPDYGGGAAPPPPAYEPAGGPVPSAPPAPPRRPPQLTAPVRYVTAGAACLVLLLLTAVGVALANTGRDDGGGAGDGSADDYGYETTEEPTSDPTTEPADDPTTEDPEVMTDAVVGDCVIDYGTDDIELEFTDCDPGAFEIIDILDGTTDTDECWDDPTTSWVVYNDYYERVLCMTYLHSGGEVYRATEDDCVWGPNDDETNWEFTDCDSGDFRVLERLTGTTDPDDCEDSAYLDWTHWYSVADDSDLDVLLCLSMIFSDDIAHAPMDTCLLMTGDEGDRSFEFADCDDSNVYVVGRTGDYEDDDFCGNYGWATRWSGEYPEIGYRVCWDWL